MLDVCLISHQPSCPLHTFLVVFLHSYFCISFILYTYIMASTSRIQKFCKYCRRHFHARGYQTHKKACKQIMVMQRNDKKMEKELWKQQAAGTYWHATIYIDARRLSLICLLHLIGRYCSLGTQLGRCGRSITVDCLHYISRCTPVTSEGFSESRSV